MCSPAAARIRRYPLEAAYRLRKFWKLADLVVLHDAFDVNCRERPCGADIFAGSAADAAFKIDNRNLGFLAFGSLCDRERDGSVRASAPAGAAMRAFGAQADILPPYCAPDLYAALLLERDWLDGTCGADLTAVVACRATVTAFKAHDWAKQCAAFVGHAEHFVVACADAELAASAVLFHREPAV